MPRKKKDYVISICVNESYYSAVKAHAHDSDTSVSALLRSLILQTFKDEINAQKSLIEEHSPYKQGNLLDYIKQSTTTTI